MLVSNPRSSTWIPPGTVCAYYPLSAGPRVQAEDLRRFLNRRRDEEAQESAAASRFRILVVDDEEMVQDYVADMLQASGFDCVVEVVSIRQLAAGNWPRGLTEPASLKPGTAPAPGNVWDSVALWRFLKGLHRWDCVNVSATHAPALGRLIEADIGANVGYYDDVYHVLPKAVADYESPFVRLLAPTDRSLLESAPEGLRESGFGDPRTLLNEGLAAGAIVKGKLVSIAHTYAPAGERADIGVYTVAQWRCRGFATAAASLVAHRAQEMGFMPVWRTEVDNVASLRVASKLGFEEASRRTYVVPDSPD